MSKRQLVQLKKEEHLSQKTELRKKCEPITEFDKSFEVELKDLIDTFESLNVAVGLAAPQIGINKSFAVVNLNKNETDKHLIMVNPVIELNTTSLKTSKESCMSLPGYRGPVSRREKVEVAYQDQHGEHKNITAKGFLARVILHEVDHLDGVLYVDRMDDYKDIEPVDFDFE